MKHITSLLFFVFFSFGLFAQYESGYALYYADYLHGRQTASGEIFSQQQLTCAHKIPSIWYLIEGYPPGQWYVCNRSC